MAQCLKISEKVSFYIASEASYVFILSGQKFIKNGSFCLACGQTVVPDRLLFIRQILVEKAKIEMRHFE